MRKTTRLHQILAPLAIAASIGVNFTVVSFADDTNPFPGVPFGGEVPGYTVEVPCQQGGDCGIGIVPVVDCPQWSAADGRNGYANDGPADDPHKKVGVARRFCRNSWTPPASAADDEDFRNRTRLAEAQATAESQAWNAAHPGEQKCFTWGPVVHANGISTASGGACANPVGTKADGTTAQVSPTPISGASGESGSSADSGSTDSPATDSGTVAPSTPAPSPVNNSQYGIGRPYTRVVSGTSANCPSGYQAASNEIPGAKLTECWPEDAWAAYSAGGNTWTAFKASNGSSNARELADQRIQINAVRILALQKAQAAAQETIGLKRCFAWNTFGQSGQECAYIPVSSSLGIPGSRPSETATSSPAYPNVSSAAGVTLAVWRESADYNSVICPVGTARSTSLDLHGTVDTSDDTWVTTCQPNDLLSGIDTASATAPVSETTTSDPGAATDTSTSVQSSSPKLMNPAVASVGISVSGTAAKVTELAAQLEDSSTVSSAIAQLASRVQSLRTQVKNSTVKLPTSPQVDESARSLTPKICTVTGVSLSIRKQGICTVEYQIVTPTGNEYLINKSFSLKRK